jgi:hypothetical protein
MMKVVTKEVQNVECEGLASLLGEPVLFICMNYHYHGTLTGVNDTCVLIENPKLVYETGSWDDSEWSDAQSLPCKEHYIQTSAIESYFKVDR